MESGIHRVVKVVRLKDEGSPRCAWYDLSILKLLDGYIIKKCSGGSGNRQNVEMWFRFSQKEAEIKFNSILKIKINPNRSSSRHYKMRDDNTQQVQMDLF